MRDFHKSIKILNAITPQAVGTTGIANGKLSGVLDRRGYESVEFIMSSGASASAADTIVPVIYESDATGSGFASVANADLIGDETALTLTAAGAKTIGYRGNKRYLKVRLYGVGTATAIVAATAMLAHPNIAPITT